MAAYQMYEDVKQRFIDTDIPGRKIFVDLPIVALKIKESKD